MTRYVNICITQQAPDSLGKVFDLATLAFQLHLRLHLPHLSFLGPPSEDKPVNESGDGLPWRSHTEKPPLCVRDYYPVLELSKLRLRVVESLAQAAKA